MGQATTKPRSKSVIVPGFGDKKSYHLHDMAYGSILGIRDAIVSRSQGCSQTTVVLDPAKVEGLTDLQKLVLADGQPSPFGGVVTGNTVTIYRD
ncbi:hypothetical protein [Glutamicibacter nicotianae]|uniref:hypothetical protein n=1 Tax=Glutamicibacter nicotianae TaxID=37929 RepID=UPI00195B344B|nr:hypothetical protein [Glutamicibacter nicotianae]MBM7767328.1 hypothetical protein [Glutamicibacter nicotianae]